MGTRRFGNDFQIPKVQRVPLESDIISPPVHAVKSGVRRRHKSARSPALSWSPDAITSICQASHFQSAQELAGSRGRRNLRDRGGEMAVGVSGGDQAGATAAYELARQGVGVDLCEAGEHMGGLARSILLRGQIVDPGPHRFLRKLRLVNSLWLDVAGSDYVTVECNTRIYYNGKFFHYPLALFNALKELGFVGTELEFISRDSEVLSDSGRPRATKVVNGAQKVSLSLAALEGPSV